MSRRTFNPDEHNPRLTPGDIKPYQTLRRHCDDPHANFQKIRTRSLWLKQEEQDAREAEKRLKFK